ncbi:HdeD family acid-resistance protein [Lysobacter cavernae]|uniref:HdeD family acid-resistance protein n=1 Tax=Lysobacter cavernae TaxID=1685901 RepID=A0ABV7RS58_9GAMM
MNHAADDTRNRNRWLMLLYGLLGLAFGAAVLLWPDNTVVALLMAFGALAVIDGIYAIGCVFRKVVALPNALLLAYAVLSIALGVVALLQPLWLAMSLFWLVAGWLIVAGIARLVLAALLRRLVEGHWWLAISGVCMIALGVFFLTYPELRLQAITLWLAVAALIYGGIQTAFALRRFRR